MAQSPTHFIDDDVIVLYPVLGALGEVFGEDVHDSVQELHHKQRGHCSTDRWGEKERHITMLKIALQT